MTLTTDWSPTAERSASLSKRLRTKMSATRVGYTCFGTRKTLVSEQKIEAAEPFGAQGEFLCAGKKLLDTRHRQFKAVAAVKNRTVSYWKTLRLPFRSLNVRSNEQFDELVAQCGQIVEGSNRSSSTTAAPCAIGTPAYSPARSWCWTDSWSIARNGGSSAPLK